MTDPEILGGDEAPEALVGALALEAALVLQSARGPEASEAPHDDLLVLARSLRSLPPTTWADARPPEEAPWPHRAARRPMLREALTAAAAVAVLGAGAGAALTSFAAVGGPGRSAPGRLALVDDQWSLVGGASSVRLASVACPGGPVCYAVGDATGTAALAVSTDSGRAWRFEHAPAGTAGLNALTCPTVTHCVAVGEGHGVGVIVATHDAGAHWFSASAPVGALTLQSVSCPEVTQCWAVGTASNQSAVITSTSDGGSHWISHTVPAGVTSLDAISCPTTSSCWAGGSTDGGAALLAGDTQGWHPVGLAAAATGIAAVSCTVDAGCWAAGPSAAGTVNVLRGSPGAATTTTVASPGAVAAGLRSSPLCPPGCAAPTSSTTRLAALIAPPSGSGPGGPATGGTLACPTALDCFTLATTGTGWSATALRF